jgi:hypothetical protein
MPGRTRAPARKPAPAAPAAEAGTEAFTRTGAAAGGNGGRAASRGVVTFEDENDDGGPHGLLQWGQAGIYNAPDDRLVVTALGNSVVGIVKPARIAAQPGLSFRVDAGWLGIASCEDGTTCVVGSRQSHVITPDQGIIAGPATGTRTDLLWCDVFPDDALWRLTVIRQGEAIGRPGLPLATITVPAGANLASQMTITNDVPTFGAMADGTVRGALGTALANITPVYPVAPWMIRPRSHFRLRAFGWGRWGTAFTPVRFRCPLSASPILYFNPTTANGFATNAEFSWECEVIYQVRMMRQNMCIKISANLSPGQGGGGPQMPPGMRGLRVTNVMAWNPDIWNPMVLQSGWQTAQANQYIECHCSTFETIEPYGGA